MKRNSIYQKKRKRKEKILFFLIMILIGVYISYQTLEKSKIKLKDKEFIHLIVKEPFQYQEKNIIDNFLEYTKNQYNPITWLRRDYQKYIQEEQIKTSQEKNESYPEIYIYNTHDTEEYYPSTYAEFSINPTVKMNDYILEDYLKKNHRQAIVEERSIQEILRQNNWKYSQSYQASRIYLEQSKEAYPTLKYFIDIHRDSLIKEKTTISIEEKSYAKILFIVGLENPNYEENLIFTEKIQSKLEKNYPGLSKGIYKKSGPGVNGVYNQDFSNNTILVEIGGFENTTTEVLNTTLAFGKCFLEAINE